LLAVLHTAGTLTPVPLRETPSGSRVFRAVCQIRGGPHILGKRWYQEQCCEYYNDQVRERRQGFPYDIV